MSQIRDADGVPSGATDHASEPQLRREVNQGYEVLLAIHLHHGARERLRLRHEPVSCAGDYAEIRLGKQSVEMCPEAVLHAVRQTRLIHGAHTGAQQVAIREYYLKAAQTLEVISLKGVTAAVLQRIGDHAAPPRRWHCHPELQALPLNMAVQIKKAHARLQDRVGLFLIDLDNAVHALEIERDHVRAHWRGATKTEVLAGGNHPEWNVMLVADPHKLLHFLCILGRNRGGWHRIPFGARER